MRALLIDQGRVTEIALPEEQGNGTDLLDAMYETIGCTVVAAAGYPFPNHVAWVDEEGLLKHVAQVHHARWFPEPLVGRIVVTGLGSEGDTTPATMTVEALAGMVQNP